MQIALIGAPIEEGAGIRGAAMGPAALRTADLEGALRSLGHDVEDLGDASIARDGHGSVQGARNAESMAAWTKAITNAGLSAFQSGAFPIFMGGDHSLSIGSVNAAACHAQELRRELMVLWLDAHSDFNTPASSPSGNIHGMPVAALTGDPSLDFLFENCDRVVVPTAAFHLFGIRSVDESERQRITQARLNVADMRKIDECGFARLIDQFRYAAKDRNAMVHVSLDVDFLDPEIAPGVGTRVCGGATYREAHLIMEILCDAGMVTSMDLAELNPFLDNEGATASLLVELAASLLGRRVIQNY